MTGSLLIAFSIFGGLLFAAIIISASLDTIAARVAGAIGRTNDK